MSMARIPFALVSAAVALFCAAVAAAKPNSHAVLECNYCHLDTPRIGIDTRETVNFWRDEGDEPQLCERCHGPEANVHPLGVVADPERPGTRVSGHLPLGKSEAVRDQVVCVSCHFIHAADADHALLRGFPGSPKPGLFLSWEDLCRECHGTNLERRSPHTGNARGCAFCHSVAPSPGLPAVVTPVGRTLCAFCHIYKNREHYIDVNPSRERQDCMGCHDPHLGRDRVALLRTGYFETSRDEVTFNPHHKRALCFTCHADGKPGPLRSADPVALCQRCHGSGKIPGMSHPMAKVPAGFVIPEGWPLIDGTMTCLTCHFPGHAPGTISGRPGDPAPGRYLLRGKNAGVRTAVCSRCHAQSQWAGRNPHREAALKKTGCTLCHAVDPEYGETASFVADINIVCLACHEDNDHPGGIRHTLTLKAGMPEVSGSLPLGVGRRITCATCHNPHLDSPRGHRLRGTKDPATFCLRCHKN